MQRLRDISKYKSHTIYFGVFDCRICGMHQPYRNVSGYNYSIFENTVILCNECHFRSRIERKQSKIARCKEKINLYEDLINNHTRV